MIPALVRFSCCFALVAGLCACEKDATEAPPNYEAEGCDVDRAATSYRATATGSVAIESATNTIPCAGLTGFGANSPAIDIAKDGTLYFAPAQTAEGSGLLRSTDRGQSWELLVPKLPNGDGHPKLQPFLYVDDASGTVYFATSKLVLNGIGNFVDDAGVHLHVSRDRGDSWTYADMSPEGRDWVKIFAGPRASGGGRATYYMLPSPIAGNWAGIFPEPDYQHVYRSLDDGGSWQEVSRLPVAPTAIEGCDPNDFAMFGQGAVSSDGTVFLGFRKCRQLAVSISDDEGVTWQTRDVSGATLAPYDTSSLAGILGIVDGENAITGEPITVDAAGNVYAIWADEDDVLHYTSSRDRGVTWNAPVWVMAPGVTSARMVTITARAPGQIAIAYFGTENGVAFHGYIAESKNALDAEPTFVTAPTNDPADPLYADGWQSGYDIGYFDNGGDEITLLRVTYAPDGSIWASFVKDMCPRGAIGACTWDYEAHNKSRFQGAWGRLVHVR